MNESAATRKLFDDTLQRLREVLQDKMHPDYDSCVEFIEEVAKINEEEKQRQILRVLKDNFLEIVENKLSSRRWVVQSKEGRKLLKRLATTTTFTLAECDHDVQSAQGAYYYNMELLIGDADNRVKLKYFVNADDPEAPPQFGLYAEDTNDGKVWIVNGDSPSKQFQMSASMRLSSLDLDEPNTAQAPQQGFASMSLDWFRKRFNVSSHMVSDQVLGDFFYRMVDPRPAGGYLHMDWTAYLL